MLLTALGQARIQACTAAGCQLSTAHWMQAGREELWLPSLSELASLPLQLAGYWTCST